MTFLCTVIVRLLYIMLSFFEQICEVRALSNVIFQYFSEIFPNCFVLFFREDENEHLHSKCKRKKLHENH